MVSDFNPYGPPAIPDLHHGLLVILIGVALTDYQVILNLAQSPWHTIFALGIVASLWAQVSVFRFFYDNGYQDASTYGGKSGKTIDSVVRSLFPILTTMLVFASLLQINNVGFHLSCVAAYLLCLALVDYLTWQLATCSSPGKEAKTNSFTEASRQLLFHIDGAAFVSIGLSVGIVWVLFAGDNVRHLREAFLAGVIGCQMILTVILVVVHLWAWQRGLLLPLNPPPKPT